MKTMLITGASKGLGLACATEFSKDYNVITVSRTGDSTYLGDLTDRKFRQKLLLEVMPDVLINNAGIPGSGNDWVGVQEINYIAAGELLVEFYKKMNSGHIINISSVSASIGGYSGISYGEIAYNASKAALTSISALMSLKSAKNIKITSLEPGLIMTDFANISRRYKGEIPDSYIKENAITPMSPDYLATTIRWILNQPDEIIIKTLEIQNRRIRQ